MPDVVNVNKELGIIEVQSFDLVSKEDIAESIATVIQINEETGINKIMVDTSEQKSMPNTVDIYDLFSKFPRDFKCVLLVNNAQKTLTDQTFVETVAQNRGIMIKLFSSRDEAFNWLKD